MDLLRMLVEGTVRRKSALGEGAVRRRPLPMTRSAHKPSGRRIIIDGIEYRWKAGIGKIEIRRDGRVFLRVDTAEALGLSEYGHERAIHKRTLNSAVTPGLVAELIRSALQ
jgi:hypothetical protein